MPLTEVVHDRLNVEVFRGCTRGCRFCQAGMITRPVRERPAEQVRTMVSEGLRRTGYDEVALTSLSTADFSGIEQTVKAIVDNPGCGQVSVSLPSLRVDAFTVGIAGEIQKARRTGLTFAPEAGTWRMRQIINKLIREEDLYAAVDSAFSSGWRRVKLYFLTGLPSETDEDTLGIVDLARNCVDIGRRYTKGASVKASVGGFVPKPFTPFQWFGQNTVEELSRKVNLLRDAARRTKSLQLTWHDPKASLAEGLASRGDRRLGPVIEAVWRRGGTFQEWSEHFDVSLWTEAMAEAGLDIEWYVYRHRTRGRGPPVGPHLRRPPQGLPLAGLAGRAGRGRPARLPVDALLRLRGLHRLRHRARRGLGHAAGRRQPGHRAGPVDRQRRARRAAAPRARRRPGRIVTRLRVRFSKFGKVRFTSHRDVARIWERSLRRGDVAVAYTEGFSPRPKLSFGLALSTGYESYGEYLDIGAPRGLAGRHRRHRRRW